MKTLLGPKFIIPSLIILAILIVVITLLAPTDRVLGEATRMVYVHGAIIRVVLGTFLLSGLLGLVYLLTRKTGLGAVVAAFCWRPACYCGFPIWSAATIATLQTWGAIAWFEPRWLVTLQISVDCAGGVCGVAGREETDCDGGAQRDRRSRDLSLDAQRGVGASPDRSDRLVG